jgi:hypothetical protein
VTTAAEGQVSGTLVVVGAPVVELGVAEVVELTEPADEVVVVELVLEELQPANSSTARSGTASAKSRGQRLGGMAAW